MKLTDEEVRKMADELIGLIDSARNSIKNEFDDIEKEPLVSEKEFERFSKPIKHSLGNFRESDSLDVFVHKLAELCIILSKELYESKDEIKKLNEKMEKLRQAHNIFADGQLDK